MSKIGGPGESQIELDKRMINSKIKQLKKLLTKVTQTREVQRKLRKNVSSLIFSLVGYTNSGKSTIFNSLTSSDILVKDMVFATLDTKMGSVKMSDNKKIIIYPDPSAKQRKTSAGGMTDLAILKNAGFEVRCRNKAPLVRDRINAVNSKLKNVKGQNSLFILKSCKNAIKSIERQIYKEGTHIPDKEICYYHMNDALGYIIEYNYPLKRNFVTNPPRRWS